MGCPTLTLTHLIWVRFFCYYSLFGIFRWWFFIVYMNVQYFMIFSSFTFFYFDHRQKNSKKRIPFSEGVDCGQRTSVRWIDMSQGMCILSVCPSAKTITYIHTATTKQWSTICSTITSNPRASTAAASSSSSSSSEDHMSNFLHPNMELKEWLSLLICFCWDLFMNVSSSICFIVLLSGFNP